MIISGANIDFLDKYFPEYFSEGDFYTELGTPKPYFLEIDQKQFNLISEFSKRYGVKNNIDNLAGLLCCCRNKFKLAKLNDETFKTFYKTDAERFKIVDAINSDFTEVIIKTKTGKVKIIDTLNLLIIRQSLKGKFIKPAKSLKSYTKKTQMRITMLDIIKKLLIIFANDIPVKTRTKKGLYLLIHEFISISGFSINVDGLNRISSPDELIKKLLQA